MPDEPVLKLETTVDDAVTVVRCSGRLISSVSTLLSAEVKPHIRSSRKIVIDLSDVTFMDSMGLGTIASLYVSCKSAGCPFELINLSRRIRDLFTMTHLLSLFEVCGETNVTMP
jgi:anti-sigma B factor antagonist